MTTRAPSAVRRFVIVAVVIPVVITAVSVLVQLWSLPALPDPIAIHWGASGRADGFGPAWVAPVTTTIVGLGVPLLISASALNGLRRGDRGAAYRFMGALAAAMSVVSGTLVAGSVLIQSGLGDAAEAPSIVPSLLLGGARGVAVGVVAWFVQPAEQASGVPVEAVAALDPPLRADERAVWLRTVRLGRSGLIVLASALLVLILVAVITVAVSGSAAATVIIVIVVLLMAVTIAAASVFHVRVDAHGLSVTSAIGFPRVHVPIEDIQRVEVVEVIPMAEFGGWGLRWAPGGGFGVVMRSGSGIRVHRAGGRVFTVTVDDAESGAALLEALRVRKA
ncbi:DUF1648 domain-containing protein [Microbacterium flavum]|uniref:DUF1648 domain-containing protein n=1 Tax=Microbacterium flavum TaxID=415216 RepID=UPI0024AE4AA8|nr:DUF1648 domain-containing protein [Microbacterium flavum]